MNLSELNLNELDFNDLGSWPLPVKIITIVLVAVSVLTAGYFMDTQTQMETLAASESKETELKETFTQKQHRAINLELYKTQMAEMEKSFGAMLRQLPGKAEVAELLVDISQTGLANGLEFQLFKPKDEEKKDYYAEVPISIRVAGSYHEFGKFVSDVAALPRIVTMQDIYIRTSASAKEGSELIMEATAKTYRYLDENESK